MIKYPDILNKIFEKLNKNDSQPIIIGGYVRDYLLNNESNDIDIEVYNISSFAILENILSEFGKINNVGKSFGVCKLQIDNLNLDFTLPRLDSKVASGHSGFNIDIKKNLDFVSATRRRDFTINAIGYDVVKKKILDPFNGIQDLKNKTLKVVDANTFVEDPLRVLRAIQFCSRFDLKMNKELLMLCKNMIDNNMLLELPKERVYNEIKKILLKSKKPSLGFKLLKQLNLFKYFPFLQELSEKKFLNSIDAIDEIAKLHIANNKTNEVLMLTCLCHNLKSEDIKNYILKLSNDKELLNRVLILCKNLNYVSTLNTDAICDYKLYKLATEVSIEEITILSEIIHKTGKELENRAKQLNIFNKKMPPFLMGRDLIQAGMKPSIKFSKILDIAYEAQMHKEFSSSEEAKEWLNKYLLFNHQ